MYPKLVKSCSGRIVGNSIQRALFAEGAKFQARFGAKISGRTREPQKRDPCLPFLTPLLGLCTTVDNTTSELSLISLVPITVLRRSEML